MRYLSAELRMQPKLNQDLGAVLSSSSEYAQTAAIGFAGNVRQIGATRSPTILAKISLS